MQVVVVVVVSVVGNWQMQSRSASAAGWPGQGLRLQLPWVLGAGRRRGVSVEAGGDDFHKLARLANAATKLKMLRHAQCAHHPLHLPPINSTICWCVNLQPKQPRFNNNKSSSNNNAVAVVVVVVVQSSCSCAGSKDLCGIWA